MYVCMYIYIYIYIHIPKVDLPVDTAKAAFAHVVVYTKSSLLEQTTPAHFAISLVYI